MSCLDVVRIFCSLPLRFVTKLLVTRNRTNLINDERQRMLCVAWLVIVDGTETAFAYSAWCIHRSEPGTVFPTKVAIGISWVNFGTVGHFNTSAFMGTVIFSRPLWLNYGVPVKTHAKHILEGNSMTPIPIKKVPAQATGTN